MHEMFHCWFDLWNSFLLKLENAPTTLSHPYGVLHYSSKLVASCYGGIITRHNTQRLKVDIWAALINGELHNTLIGNWHCLFNMPLIRILKTALL